VREDDAINLSKHRGEVEKNLGTSGPRAGHFFFFFFFFLLFTEQESDLPGATVPDFPQINAKFQSRDADL